MSLVEVKSSSSAERLSDIKNLDKKYFDVMGALSVKNKSICKIHAHHNKSVTKIVKK